MTANYEITHRLRCQLWAISYSLMWKNQIIVFLTSFLKIAAAINNHLYRQWVLVHCNMIRNCIFIGLFRADRNSELQTYYRTKEFPSPRLNLIWIDLKKKSKIFFYSLKRMPIHHSIAVFAAYCNIGKHIKRLGISFNDGNEDAENASLLRGFLLFHLLSSLMEISEIKITAIARFIFKSEDGFL